MVALRGKKHIRNKSCFIYNYFDIENSLAITCVRAYKFGVSGHINVGIVLGSFLPFTEPSLYVVDDNNFYCP